MDNHESNPEKKSKITLPILILLGALFFLAVSLLLFRPKSNDPNKEMTPKTAQDTQTKKKEIVDAFANTGQTFRVSRKEINEILFGQQTGFTHYDGFKNLTPESDMLQNPWPNSSFNIEFGTERNGADLVVNSNGKYLSFDGEKLTEITRNYTPLPNSNTIRRQICQIEHIAEIDCINKYGRPVFNGEYYLIYVIDYPQQEGWHIEKFYPRDLNNRENVFSLTTELRHYGPLIHRDGLRWFIWSDVSELMADNADVLFLYDGVQSPRKINTKIKIMYISNCGQDICFIKYSRDNENLYSQQNYRYGFYKNGNICLPTEEILEQFVHIPSLVVGKDAIVFRYLGQLLRYNGEGILDISKETVYAGMSDEEIQTTSRSLSVSLHYHDQDNYWLIETYGRLIKYIPGKDRGITNIQDGMVIIDPASQNLQDLYYIEGGEKRRIPSPETYHLGGFDQKKIYLANSFAFRAIPNGYPVFLTPAGEPPATP